MVPPFPRAAVRGFTLPALLLFASPQAASKPARRIERDRLTAHVAKLASAEFQGRRTGTEGAEKARNYIIEQLKAMDVPPAGAAYELRYDGAGGRTRGETASAPAETASKPASIGDLVNVAARIEGRTHKDQVIVVSAHYDHLGAENGKIFYGADDNASGCGGVLEAARWFKAHPPEHTIVFAWFDREEQGLVGSRAFVKTPPVPRKSIVLNINMDMVSRNAKGELWACGTRHYPQLRPAVEKAAARASIKLLIGHDSGDPRSEDWTGASDQGSFHNAKIPMIYFGVEDHEDYHHPTDEASRIQPDFYAGAVEAVLDVVLELDAAMPPAKK